MSSPAQGGPSAPKEKKGVSSRVFTRMKTIIKKAEKRMSLSGPSKSSAAAQASSAAPEASAKAKGKQPEVVYPDAEKVPRSQLHQERARKFEERFGLEIKPNEWYSTEGDALRVNKPIRMRVHRICHNCNTEFGVSKECSNCKHSRCKKCPRYPPKRTEAEKIASRERRAELIKQHKENAPIPVDWNAKFRKEPVVLRIPAKTNAQDLIYKKPRQRVRRTCCQCSELFVSSNKSCPGCQHARCTDCPRDPAKKNKYPFGYPGDEFGANSIPVYKCNVCKTRFPVGTQDGTECVKCGNPKNPSCPRQQPRRIEPEPDPAVLQALGDRLAQLSVG